MHDYIHNANIELYRRLIIESECDSKRDENRHKTLLRLLDEENAKDKKSQTRLFLETIDGRMLLRFRPREHPTGLIGRHLNSDDEVNDEVRGNS